MPLPVCSLLKHVAAAAAATLLLSGCQESQIPKQLKPVPTQLSEKMKQMDMSETAPIFIRIFKESSELEVWKQKRNGKFALLKTYGICKWSGALGPKVAEGDRQAPEGFYTVTPAQMNPQSSYYLSFNIGYPNAFDRALGRTGSNLMVHGACSSAGCYSMTDENAGELFALARDSFRGGQTAFQIQAFPFRMTPENMAKHRDSEYYAFWQMLKTGSDHFELTRVPPKVDVCDKHYVFDADAGSRQFSPAAACPMYEVPEELRVAVAQKQAADEAATAAAVARLEQEAQIAAETKRLAEEKQLADATKAAEQQAAKQAKTEQRQERLGIFGRVFGRSHVAAASAPVAEAAPAADVSPPPPVTAFAPAEVPLPPKKPAAKPELAVAPMPAAPLPVASVPAPPPLAPAIPAPVASATPASQPALVPAVQPGTQPTEPTTTSETPPPTPPVGRIVKKDFLWVGDDG